ncbi:DUF3592 domain-containing protein [Streptomyces puniciscabiei]|uniref:DUF3592 domain-containing protein n=1 Tax=Streptomyces puniciscabiei TaxID=164348 RepID=UPI0033183343
MQVKVRGQAARRWIPFGVVAFGALFLVIGLILAGVSVAFLVHADRARGTVVSLEWRTDHDHTGPSRRTRTSDQPMAYPVVEFRSADGRARTFQSSTGSNPPSYEVGERVEVLYHAASPGDARINGFASLWLLPLVFGGIGLVAGGIGTGLALATRRGTNSRS